MAHSRWGYSMKRSNPETVESEITALDEMDASALRLRWQAVYGRAAPQRIREVLLRKAIAYQLQVLAFGGLKPATVRRLAKIANALRESGSAASRAARQAAS